VTDIRDVKKDIMIINEEYFLISNENQITSFKTNKNGSYFFILYYSLTISVLVV